ncbi:flavo protein [Sphaerosporella brunnea]|uniref:Flavo protein n=1 Tax=Sphaerosporella brunnea TaxID=1250544 RepID=A0A5J5ERN4_9PEZI|nr:flavo protein [Sphaerosporella brunnea]
MSTLNDTYPHNPSHPNLLLFATGSVATIKLPQLVITLLQHPLNIKVILSPTATRFLSPSDLSSISSFVKVYTNDDEWAQPWSRGDPVLHIELRKWADMLLIAPLSANSLAGMAGGFCFGLGLSVVRAWDTTAAVGDRGAMGAAKVVVANRVRKMILVAPAMNTQMYLHPVTEEHLAKLGRWGWVKVLKPVEKMLACGDLGVGGMMEVPDIVDNVLEVLGIRAMGTHH